MSRPGDQHCPSDDENSEVCVSPSLTWCHCSQGRHLWFHQLSGITVGEMPPDILIRIAEILNLHFNYQAIQLCTFLGYNTDDMAGFEKQPNVSWALFKRCSTVGMDQIAEGLMEINSVSVNIIRQNLTAIHAFVRYRRGQMLTPTSCDPQQNTESSSSLSHSLPSEHSSQYTCHCGDHQSRDSECSGDTRTTGTQGPRSRLNSYDNNNPMKHNGSSTQEQPLSQHPDNFRSEYEQSTFLKAPYPDSSTDHIGASGGYHDVMEENPSNNKRKLKNAQSNRQVLSHRPTMQISNPSSDEESGEELPKIRQRTRSPPRDVYIFITGGNSPEDVNNIKKSLRALMSSLPYQLIWDSPMLSGEQWKNIFQKAALVVIGLTRDYAANIGRARQWPSRAQQINEYIQRELLKNHRRNKRFVNVILSKSGLKKADLSFELSGSPFMWPDESESLLQRVKEKMNKR